MRPAPVVRTLVIVTTVAFLVQLAVDRFTGFETERWFGLSAEYAVGRLCVWQFVTWLFLHSPGHLFHILFNMLVLWMFGKSIEQRFGPRKFLLFYFTAGIFSGLGYVLVSAFGESFRPAIGASGAIMGLLVAFGMLFPDAVVLAFLLIPMKAKHLVWLLVGIDLVYFFFMTGTDIAVSAHLAGALYGFLFLRLEPRVIARLRRIEADGRRKGAEDERHARERVDALLAKIGRGERLSSKERRFLDRASRRYFGRR